MEIKTLTDAGLKCPHCGSIKIRGCYHDHSILDSLVCLKCGLRWIEDTGNLERFVNNVLKQSTKNQLKERIIWVMHIAENLQEPLYNAASADEQSYSKFIEKAKHKDS